MSTKLSVSHLDTLLSGSTQIRPGQGKDVLQLALSGQTRTTAEKAAGQGCAPQSQILFFRQNIVIIEGRAGREGLQLPTI